MILQVGSFRTRQTEAPTLFCFERFKVRTNVTQIFIVSCGGSQLQRGRGSIRATTKVRNINQNIAVNREEKRRGSCVNIGGWVQEVMTTVGLAVKHKAKTSDPLVKQILLPEW